MRSTMDVDTTVKSIPLNKKVNKPVVSVKQTSDGHFTDILGIDLEDVGSDTK